jgi:hypothetical protein
MISIAVPLWALLHRVFALKISVQLSLSFNYIKSRSESEPDKTIAVFLNKVSFFLTSITVPPIACCLSSKPPEFQHKAHHTIQLCFEMILVATSFILQHYLYALAIVSGFIGSLSGLLHRDTLGFYFNLLGITFSSILAAVEISHFSCVQHRDQILGRFLAIALVAGLYMNLVRVNVSLHSYLASRSSTWKWLNAQMQRLRKNPKEISQRKSFWDSSLLGTVLPHVRQTTQSTDFVFITDIS